MVMMPHDAPVPAGPGTLTPEVPASAPAAGHIQAKPRSMFRRGWEVFAENKLALVGLGFVIFVILFAFVGPHIYVTPQVTVQTQDYLCKPSGAHLLGCDELGYDVIGRLMVGGQNSLEVGLAAAFVACLFGSIYGAVSGFAGGIVDAFMMRIVDAMLSIPFIFVLIILAVLIRPSALTLIGFIAITYWPGPARLVRGETLSLRTREYVAAVKVAGGRSTRAVLRHVMPNAIGTIIVQATFAVADSILILSGLGFLGFGIQLPSTDWGSMLSNGLQFVNLGYWWLIYPAGLIIIATVVSFNFIGDALRDAFETRLQRR
ncbi:MAG TPA: ABC transporter permease [Streptosporangiaceae bacterium]|nr:ABC transporter permease [Streptosporangiaceae bacterium]HUC59796.1 ABC transporter permease [Streptosporangiaceae bacterium]